MQMDGKPAKRQISEEIFVKVRDEAERKYKETPKVACPYFKGEVHFNAKGLDHIKFKDWGKSRSRFDQFIRLKLLYLAPIILKKSSTVQGIWHKKEWERRKRHEKWEKIQIDISYYEFVAVIGKIRLKIIIKEVKGGVRYFWTLIPFWRTNEVTDERLMHSRDTENETWDDENEESDGNKNQKTPAVS